MKASFGWYVSIVVCATLFLSPLASAVDSQEPAQASCDQFLLPAREVKGKTIGPTSCQMQESTLMCEGRSFRRVDFGLDGKRVFVDMNLNGVWDFRETPTAAWQRLGLLQRNETLTRQKYASCVQKAADQLYKDGFISEKTATWYLD